MNTRKVAIFLSVVLLVAVGIRSITFLWDNYRGKQETLGICTLVEPRLIIGAVRESYETATLTLSKLHRLSGAKIQIVDHGAEYPFKQEFDSSFRRVECTLSGVEGISFSIFVPKKNFFDPSFAVMLLGTFTCALILLWMFRFLFSRIQENLHREYDSMISKSFGLRTQTESTHPILESVLRFILPTKSATIDKIKNQVDLLKKEVERQKLLVAEEARSRIVKETELKKNLEFVETVRQIRHDIRHPLQTLLSLQDSNSESPDLCKSLAIASKRIEQMINELDFKEGTLSDPRTDIVEVLVQEVVSEYRPSFQRSKAIELKFVAKWDNLASVVVEPWVFKRVIANILQNAYEASDEGGSITVTCEKSNGRAKICVEDEGSGVPADVLPRLFGRGVTFGKQNGQGLALFSAREAVTKWNGQISMESKPRDTKVIVELPLINQGITFVGPSVVREVYLVDDDASMVRRVRDCEIGVLSSAQSFEAARKLVLKSAHDPSIPLLLDFQLDSGYTALDLLERTSIKNPVILCTNDYAEVKVMKVAAKYSARIMPKPLLFLWAAKSSWEETESVQPSSAWAGRMVWGPATVR